jgi:hypothetical protein
MKTVICTLALLNQITLGSLATAGLPETIHYWGMADHTPKGGTGRKGLGPGDAGRRPQGSRPSRIPNSM